MNSLATPNGVGVVSIENRRGVALCVVSGYARREDGRGLLRSWPLLPPKLVLALGWPTWRPTSGARPAQGHGAHRTGRGLTAQRVHNPRPFGRVAVWCRLASVEQGEFEGVPAKGTAHRRRRVLRIGAALLVLLVALAGLYSWRAVSEFRAFESVWLEWREEMSALVTDVRGRQDQFNEGLWDDDLREGIITDFAEVVSVVEHTRLEVREQRVLTFGVRDLRSLFLELLSLSSEVFATLGASYRAGDVSDLESPVFARAEATEKLLESRVESFRARWHLSDLPAS